MTPGGGQEFPAMAGVLCALNFLAQYPKPKESSLDDKGHGPQILSRLMTARRVPCIAFEASHSL